MSRSTNRVRGLSVLGRVMVLAIAISAASLDNAAPKVAELGEKSASRVLLPAVQAGLLDQIIIIIRDLLGPDGQPKDDAPVEPAVW